ncbi:hypothetical protein BBJ28_00000914 [Nothophytophthora sp. Chile5]|nr:hypothetical protein BBJ28_00000914 [Nothophytophthora sp. Chile5]
MEAISFKKKARRSTVGRKRPQRPVDDDDEADGVKREAEAPDLGGEEDADQTQRTIEEVREDQRLRAQLLREGLASHKPVGGGASKKAKQAETGSAASDTQQYGLHDPKKDGSANQKLLTLLDGQFTGQSATSEKDQHEELMNKYIEEKLQKQRPSDGQQDSTSSSDAAAAAQSAEDALFALPAHLKPDVPVRHADDSGESGGMLMGNAGIAEVELPASYAEKTEQATLRALEASRSGANRHGGVGGLASSALPANFSTDFNRHRSDFVADLKNMRKGEREALDEQRERGFRKVGKNQASDDRAVSRFRKFESRKEASGEARSESMSWLWGNETTEQAQIVVSALQGELDERETKIKALEAALRREQQDFTSLLQDEVKELETRRKAIEQELAGVDALIKEKQRLIQRSKSDGQKKKKKAKKAKAAGSSAVSTPVASPRAAATDEEKPEAAAVVSPKAKSKQLKKKKSGGAVGYVIACERWLNLQGKADLVERNPLFTMRYSAAPATPDAVGSKTVLPMDEKLQKIAKEEPNVAFIIQRSTNANTVVYAGHKTATGSALDPEKPLGVYWIMYEKEGAPREDLNMIERNTAYGVTCSPSNVAGQFMAAIASLRDRDCILRLDAHGNVMALTTINGKKGMLLRRVYVQMTTSWGIPTVDYVEIFGVHPTTFEPVYEKKKNK